jgi:AcrR family transcriptional regulator
MKSQRRLRSRPLALKRAQAPAQRKPRGEGYQRRAEILAAARSLFLKEGVERVTIRAICARVGVTAPALYRHFKDKREIIIGICNETFGKLLERFRRIRATEADALEALKQLCESYVLFALAHRDEYRLLFMSKDLLMIEVADELEIKTDEDAIRAGILGPLVLHELAQHVALCIERGVLRPGDPGLITESIWSCGHGLASLLITHPHFKERPHEALIATSIDMVLNGFLKR